MTYADPLAYERARCAEQERVLAKRGRVAELRRLWDFRQGQIKEKRREMEIYRASPVARRIRFAKLRQHVRMMREVYRSGRDSGREFVMDGPVHRDGPSLGQRVRGAFTRVLGRSRGGNVERERSKARERVQERTQQRQKTRPPQQKTRTSWAGPEKQKTRARSRSRGQRVR